MNGAYIVMGLLYGEGDPDQTIIVSMRCGQDSDCNPSNAAGILFTTIGYENLPERFISGLDTLKKFSFTDYSFPELVDICEIFAIEMVRDAGGRLDIDDDGEEILIIPVLEPIPGPLEQSWDPGHVSQNSFSKAELRQIKGSKLFNYALLILVVLVALVTKENRNIRTLMILVPFLLLYGLLELLRLLIPSIFQTIIDFVVVYQSFAATIAVLLLLGQRMVFSKRAITAGAALLILLLIGFIGIVGSTDGRIIASTKISLIAFLVQAILWFFAILITVMLNRKSYKRARFNLMSLLSLLIFHFLGISIFVIIISSTSGLLAERLANIYTIVIGAILFTVVHYILILVYLIATYINPPAEKRLLVLLNK